MSWDKLWAINKKVIDPVAPRHVALDKRGLVRVLVQGAENITKAVALHPKNPDVGTKQACCWLSFIKWSIEIDQRLFQVAYSNQIWVETVDAQGFAVDEVVTFMEWGNAVVTNVVRDKYSVCDCG